MPTKPGLPAAFADLVDGRLLGAKCVGHHRLFDADLDNMHESTEQRSARHAHAPACVPPAPYRPGAPPSQPKPAATPKASGPVASPPLAPLGRPRKDLSA